MFERFFKKKTPEEIEKENRIKFLKGQEQAWSARQDRPGADWDTPQHILDGRKELEELQNK